MKPSTVYGSLMHHRAELQALAEAAHQPPYNAPPQAPVLYIKPANTFGDWGDAFHLPTAQTQVLARACAGLIYSPNQPTAVIKSIQYATNNIAIEDWKLALLCDFTLPHTSYYRPPLRFNALNGSLALPRHWIDWPAQGIDHLLIETWVNGQCAHSYNSADWLLCAREQLQAVSEFIAWESGDVLMLGCPPDAPLVSAGDVVEARLNDDVFTRTLIAPPETA